MKYRDPRSGVITGGLFTGIKMAGQLVGIIVMLIIICLPFYYGLRLVIFGAQATVAVAQSGDDLRELGEAMENDAEMLRRHRSR